MSVVRVYGKVGGGRKVGGSGWVRGDDGWEQGALFFPIKFLTCQRLKIDFQCRNGVSTQFLKVRLILHNLTRQNEKKNRQ